MPSNPEKPWREMSAGDVLNAWTFNNLSEGYPSFITRVVIPGVEAEVRAEAEGRFLDKMVYVARIADLEAKLAAVQPLVDAARREGAREALTRIADMGKNGKWQLTIKRDSPFRPHWMEVAAFRDREYPAPPPAVTPRVVSDEEFSDEMRRLVSELDCRIAHGAPKKAVEVQVRRIKAYLAEHPALAEEAQ